MLTHCEQIKLVYMEQLFLIGDEKINTPLIANILSMAPGHGFEP